MSIFSVRILINSFINRPSTHFRSFTKTPSFFNKSSSTTTTTFKFKYQRQFTKREANLHKQLIQRYMAAPMNDENVEKLLEPFRHAVKLQVKKKLLEKIIKKSNLFSILLG